jgi:phage/plasmid-like protein (TIGR03299 family)
MTAEEASKEANMNYIVQSFPIYRDDKETVIESHVENRRTDNNESLAIVGKGYKIVQNHECFTFFDQIVGEGKAIYETAGVLGKGGVVFMTARLPKYVEVTDKEVLEMYIALVSSHDMSYALTAFLTPIRIVCNNTLNAGLRSVKNKVYLRHTENIKDGMFDAATLLGVSEKYMENLKENMTFLMGKQIRKEAFRDIIVRSFLNKDELKTLAMKGPEALELSTRKNNILKAVFEYHDFHPHMEGIRGTGYGAYNAITGYFQNVKDYASQETKVKNIIFQGNDYVTTQKVFAELLKA